ncbi:MAG: UvrD-helicase domain-containing protein, partial [Ruminococcus sp.]|nr:UvrD-helicase domain-containing protein [Ruminococcus sp.]
MNFTEQQQNAIDVRNSSVIVSAAAGSGKTAVLTERLAHIISDPL